MSFGVPILPLLLASALSVEPTVSTPDPAPRDVASARKLLPPLQLESNALGSTTTHSDDGRLLPFLPYRKSPEQFSTWEGPWGFAAGFYDHRYTTW